MKISIRVLCCSLFVLTGCGGAGSPEAVASPCVTPSPATNAADVPEDLPFAEWGTVTYVKRTKRFAAVRLVAETTVVELHPKIARSLIDNGYKIVGADNEGFESEIFVDPGTEKTGYFQLREGPCKDLVTTSILFGDKP